MQPWEGLLQIQDALCLIEDAIADLRHECSRQTWQEHDVRDILVGNRIALDALSKRIAEMHGTFQ